MTPAISVVISTYNRSNVLRYAIESLRRGSFQGWELIVVGDACTDDTAEVAASFADPRIRFTNLPENHGEQSKPNNTGVAMARADLVAFLNHDDLWFPEHLAHTVAFLESSGADIVNSLILFLQPGGALRFSHLLGSAPDGRYAPQCYMPASSWVLKRRLAQAIGGWRDRRECWAIPSQDFLFRAHKAGAVMRTLPEATVVAFSSVARPNCYAERASAENKLAFETMVADPGFRERLLLEHAVAVGEEKMRLSISGPLRELNKNLIYSLLGFAGGHREGFRNAVLYRRKGGVIDVYRRARGLPPARTPTSTL